MDSDKIKQIIEKLEAAIHSGQGPEYEESMTDDQVDEILKKRVCKLDALSLIDIIEIFKDLPFKLELLKTCENRCVQINQISQDVRNSKDKEAAYREAAKKLDWGVDHREIENTKLLFEYMDLIGVSLFWDLRSFEESSKIIFSEEPLPKQMEKDEAIEFLTKKYQIKTTRATYDRLKRARKKRISESKVQNEDFTHLEHILPSTWPFDIIKLDKFDEAPERKINCLLYEQCYNRAAYANASLDCHQCKKYEPILL